MLSESKRWAKFENYFWKDSSFRKLLRDKSNCACCGVPSPIYQNYSDLFLDKKEWRAFFYSAYRAFSEGDVTNYFMVDQVCDLPFFAKCGWNLRLEGTITQVENYLALLNRVNLTQKISNARWSYPSFYELRDELSTKRFNESAYKNYAESYTWGVTGCETGGNIGLERKFKFFGHDYYNFIHDIK